VEGDQEVVGRRCRVGGACVLCANTFNRGLPIWDESINRQATNVMQNNKHSRKIFITNLADPLFGTQVPQDVIDL